MASVKEVQDMADGVIRAVALRDGRILDFAVHADPAGGPVVALGDGAGLLPAAQLDPPPPAVRLITPVRARSVADVVELLDALGLERVGLLGVGRQRRLAGRVVAAHPRRVGRVAILDHGDPLASDGTFLAWLAAPESEVTAEHSATTAERNRRPRP
jgi:pimeloyl-ACP methyl ester carboxylesterase